MQNKTACAKNFYIAGLNRAYSELIEIRWAHNLRRCNNTSSLLCVERTLRKQAPSTMEFNNRLNTYRTWGKFISSRNSHISYHISSLNNYITKMCRGNFSMSAIMQSLQFEHFTSLCWNQLRMETQTRHWQNNTIQQEVFQKIILQSRQAWNSPAKSWNLLVCSNVHKILPLPSTLSHINWTQKPRTLFF